MFQPGLLEGRRVVLAGPAGGDPPAGEIDAAVLGRLRALGARVDVIDPETLTDEAATDAWAEARAPLDALVFLAAAPFGPGGADRLLLTLEAGWRAVHGSQPHLSGDGGRLVLVTPGLGAGDHDEAARAGLENLARTLSVEWARFGVTAVAVTPGPATAPADVADLVAYLLSPAGGYLSGCRLSLGQAAPAPAAG
jgi:NAD(P)-dependent dehydrogenase (short-subunit alcohol dehydrogenase family)